MKKTKVSFETSMKKLEDIVRKLESGEETLEDSVMLYQEGMDISNYCLQMLENAEQKISIIETGDK